MAGLVDDTGVIAGVSVVMPCYNAAAFLDDALKSMLAQESAPAMEVVVVDEVCRGEGIATRFRWAQRAEREASTWSLPCPEAKRVRCTRSVSRPTRCTARASSQ